MPEQLLPEVWGLRFNPHSQIPELYSASHGWGQRDPRQKGPGITNGAHILPLTVSAFTQGPGEDLPGSPAESRCSVKICWKKQKEARKRGRKKGSRESLLQNRNRRLEMRMRAKKGRKEKLEEEMGKE